MKVETPTRSAPDCSEDCKNEESKESEKQQSGGNGWKSLVNEVRHPLLGFLCVRCLIFAGLLVCCPDLRTTCSNASPCAPFRLMSAITFLLCPPLPPASFFSFFLVPFFFLSFINLILLLLLRHPSFYALLHCLRLSIFADYPSLPFPENMALYLIPVFRK